MVKRKMKKMIKENPNKTVERQFLWLVGFIILLIITFVFVPILYHQIFEKFEYGGVKFEKIKTGKLEFYHGEVTNWITYSDGRNASYNLYFRTDPRKNNISLNTNFILSPTVRISLNEGVNLCEDMVLAQSAIGQFISSFPFVKNLSGGVYNNTIAKELNLTHITCKNASADNTVIIIQKSESPSIELGDSGNCYVLNIGKCQYLETVERYIMGAVAQIKGKPLN